MGSGNLDIGACMEKVNIGVITSLSYLCTRDLTLLHLKHIVSSLLSLNSSLRRNLWH